MNKVDKIKLAIKKGYTCNPETGEVFGARGGVLKHKNKEGYLCFKIQHDNKSYRIPHHQFIYYWAHLNFSNKMEINHINRIKTDNRIANLESITHQENMWNTESKGAYFMKRLNKWQSQIGLNGKIIYLGIFNSESEAKEAYIKAKKVYHK